jgi:hypothetical protein
MPTDANPTESSTVENPTETVDAGAQAQTTEQSQSEESTPSSESSESTTASDKDGKTGSEPVKKPEPVSPAEKRIKQLLAENKRLKQNLPAQPAKPQTPAPAALEAPVKPKQDDFDSYEKFEAAKDDYSEKLADYKAKKAIADHETARETQRQKDEAAKAKQAAETAWEQRVEDTLTRLPEFDAEAAISEVDPTPAMEGFLVRSKIGPDVLAHLQENPDDAKRIRELEDPYEVASEMRDIERSLQDQIKGLKKPSAPKPPSYVSGGGSPATKPLSHADVLYGAK